MPRRAKRPCSHAGCPELIEAGCCPRHTQARAEERRRQDRQRGSAAARGYGSRWRRYRAWFLALPENVLCACGCGRLSTDVDHIQAVTGPDDRLFWEPTNHQALAHECHSRKTVREDGGWGR
jgi:5-methylcytosine-specific restriction enzyme A